MRFSWDENKNCSNYSKHGVYFETAMLIFDDPRFIMGRDLTVDDEERWQTIGLVQGILLLVAHTMGEIEDQEIVRIISAREVTARERKVYEEGLE
ncbi:MAG TPA: BrnT family toxin [Edaphobacter sp.]|nr:BrnT family toxin [Edaphobacter sp.]